MPRIPPKFYFFVLYKVFLITTLVLNACTPNLDLRPSSVASKNPIVLNLLATWEMYNASDVVWNPSSEVFAVSGVDQNNKSVINIYDAASHQMLWSKGAVASGLAFSLNGELIAVVNRLQGIVQLRKTKDGTVVKTMVADNCGGGNIIFFTPDGSKLIVGSLALPGSQSSNVNLWNIDTGSCEEIVTVAGYLTFVDININGDLIAFGSFFNENLVTVWDIRNQKQLCSLKGKFGLFVPNTKFLAVSLDNTLGFIDSYTCLPMQEYSVNLPYLGYMDFDANGNLLVSAGKYIQISEASTGNFLSQANLPEDLDPSASNTKIAFSPDSQHILVVFSTQVDSKYQDVIQLWEVSK